MTRSNAEKLREARANVLKALISEEIDMALVEQFGGDPGYEDGYGVDPNYGSGGGGYNTGPTGSMWDRKGLFGAMGFTAMRDIWNILKRGAAKLGTQLVSTVGTLIGGTFAAMLPFNNPIAVEYIGKKMLHWEQTAMKAINRQFEAELSGFDSGWNAIKPDLMGFGFFLAPYSVLTNSIAAGRGIDAALSIANVISGGVVGHVINRLIEEPDIRDPGTLGDYVRHKDYLRRVGGVPGVSAIYRSTAPKSIMEGLGGGVPKLDKDLIDRLQQKYGNDFASAAREIMVGVASSDDGLAGEKSFMERSLPAAASIFTRINNDIASGVKTGKLPVTQQELAAYRMNAGKMASASMNQIMRTKKLATSSASKAAQAKISSVTTASAAKLQ